ncbi:hypothetical protein JCM8547_006456 [Rhodosporidiobolus lusitaniae]
MADPAPPSPAELVRQLRGYANAPELSDSLVPLLRPPRLGLRSSPSSRSTYGSAPDFWPALAAVWKVEARRLADEDKSAIPAVTALAAFLLSLCTQELENQAQAVQYVEPELRKVLHVSSALFKLEDVEYQPMTRICCQALANLVTGNEALASRFFPERLRLEEEDMLLQRLLAAPDQGTVQALLIFVVNSIHGNQERAFLFGTSKAGVAILDRLLTLVGALYDDETPEGIANEEFSSDIFSLTFAIIRQLITLNVFAETFKAYPVMPDFAIDPTLVTLLKFLDGYLSLSSTSLSFALSLVPFLVQELSHLTSFLVKEKNAGVPRAHDAADAATFQGVVLVLHGLCSVGLSLEKERAEEVEKTVEESEADEAVKGMIEGVDDVVSLLRFSQILLPPPTSATAPPSSSPTPSPPSPPPLPPAAIPAIAQLQRTGAQFLGIVSFSPSNTTSAGTLGASGSGLTKVAQDRVRKVGGLVVLLGMCQIDERNPTMREHALFAIRNLLKGNLESQEFVAGLKAQYAVGAGGELLDLPLSMRKT